MGVKAHSASSIWPAQWHRLPAVSAPARHLRRYKAFQGHGAACCLQPLCIEIIFHNNRNAVQGPQFTGFSKFCIQGAGRGHSFGIDENNRFSGSAGHRPEYDPGKLLPVARW